MSEMAPPAATDGASGARQRKLAAILFADVVGYSRLMGEDETATYDALQRLRRAIDPMITGHAGRIVSTAGDGLLADFGSVVDALTCAVEMQQAARDLNSASPPDRHLQLRIGVNLGDVIVADDNDLYGDGVNIAARLQALAAPGGICMSHTVYEQVKNKLALDYRSLGAHRVKNIAEPVRVYAVGPAVPAAATRLLTRWRMLIAVGVAGIVIAAGLVVVVLDRSSRQSSPVAAPAVATLAAPARLAERTAIAVLPFKNLSGDAGQDFFSDGVTEDIINALGRYSNLLVAAKSASFQFKGRNVSPEEAGRTLDVRYLVEGSVRRAGDRLRITVELTEAGTGFHLWSDDYNIETKDVFAVQDEITKHIVGATAVKLTQFERDRVLRKPTANLAAYEFVLRGRTSGLINQTRAANDEARAMFQRAIDLDPNYADAYAALGWTHYEAAVSGWSEFRDDEVKQAETLAQKALALDPATTNAYRLLDVVNVFRHDYDRALAQVDRALALNPSAAENFQERGYLLVWSGKPAEAVPWIEATLRLDGSSSRAAMLLGLAKYFLGQYAEAVTALDRTLASSPGRAIELQSHAVLAAAYGRLERRQDAERERAVIDHIAPFFDAERFASQFGTKEARDEMLAGLKAAGFR
ncbi:MAG TPA: adenylate/guanylate cyclase domain-containing protein [Stellaceae bacterium]